MRLFPTFSSSSSPHHCVRCTFCSSTAILRAVGAKHPPTDLVRDIPCRLASGVRSWMSKRATTSLLTPCSTVLQDWACFAAPYRSPTGTASQMAPPASTSLFWHPFLSQIAAVPSTNAVKVESHAWQLTSDRQTSDTQVQKQCQIFLRDSNAAIKIQMLRRQEK